MQRGIYNSSLQDKTKETYAEDTLEDAEDDTFVKDFTNLSALDPNVLTEILRTVREVRRAAAILLQLRKEISQIRTKIAELKQDFKALLTYCGTLRHSLESSSMPEGIQF